MVSEVGMNRVKRPSTNAGIQVVRDTGNAACRNARATRAGLNVLKPRPPNSAFPSRMAITPPANPIHNGRPGGRVKASRRPVITALKSPTVVGLPDTLQTRCSVRTVAAVVAQSSASALSPNAQTANAHTGISAYTTLRMIASVVTLALICGEVRISKAPGVMTVTKQPSFHG